MAYFRLAPLHLFLQYLHSACDMEEINETKLETAYIGKTNEMNLIYWIFSWNSFCVPYYILTCLLCQLYVAIKLITLTSRFQILRRLLIAFIDWGVGVYVFTPPFTRTPGRFFWRLAKKIAATCWAFCNLRWGYLCFECAAKLLVPTTLVRPSISTTSFLIIGMFALNSNCHT